MVHKVRIFPFPLKSSVQISTLHFVVMCWNFGYHLRHVNIFHINLLDWILIQVRHVRKSFYLLMSDKNGKSGIFGFIQRFLIFWTNGFQIILHVISLVQNMA